MRKIVITLVALFTVALLFSSCKSHETCPAYGKVVNENTEVSV